MARKRSRRRKAKKSGSKSIKSMLRQVVNKGAAPLAFWQQLSEKDYQVLNADGNYRALDYLGKLKVAANILTGSLTGRVLFSDQYNPQPGGQPRINPAGIINKWVGIGVAGKLYGKIGKSMKLPEAAMIDRVGSKVIFGGAVGGFFDPPGNPGGSGGYWLWDLQNTYPSGLNFGPGWRFVNTTWFGNPDWGSSSTGPFTMRFRVTVDQTCTPDNLSISMNVIGDCLTGGWNNGACCNDPAFNIYNGNVQVVTPITSNINHY